MLFILLAYRLRKLISTAAHAGTGLHFVIKVCFCFAVCAPISPLSLSAKSVSCRFDKRICAGVEVWMSFTSLVWQEETARCGLSLTKVKNHEVCWLCENKVWNEKQRLLADFLVSWRKKSSASFEKQCDIAYVNITVYNNVSKYIFTIEFDPICHVAHHSVVTNSSDCEVSASLSWMIGLKFSGPSPHTLKAFMFP